MTTKKAISQRSAEKKKDKKVSCIDEWDNCVTHKKDFMTNTKLERLCEKLIDWARLDNEAIKVKEFLGAEGIDEETWRKWTQRYDIAREAQAKAKMFLGNRREKGMMTRKYDITSTMRMQGFYDNDWREETIWLENLKKKDGDGEGGGTKFVVIEKYPESPLVPKKKESE